jgi:hypothetical protein
VAIRLPVDVIKRIDQWARDRGVSRSHFFRVLLEEGAQALRRKQTRAAKAEKRNAAIVEPVLAESEPEPEPAPIVSASRGRRGMTPGEVKAAADRAERSRR